MMTTMFLIGYQTASPCSPDMINGVEDVTDECYKFMYDNKVDYKFPTHN